MKFIIATLAATASALPWEKEVACGFDAACGFDVVIDEATGCGFDVSGWNKVSNYDPDDGAGDRGGNSGCTGCAACKAAGGQCEGCSGGCPNGGCDSGSGCRNGSCGNAGNGGNDWCIGGTDCETSPDMVCNGSACDDWCPNASVECILNALPPDFSPCCAAEQLAGGFSQAADMAWAAIHECNETGPDGDLIGYMQKRGISQDDCCGCYCNFGCSCDCSGSCGPCGCASCSGNCNVDGSTGGASPILTEESGNAASVGAAEREEDEVSSAIGGHYISKARHYREKRRRDYGNAADLVIMYGSSRSDALRHSYKYDYMSPGMPGGGSAWGSYASTSFDVQCGFDAKTQEWVDIKCGFDNNCGFDFECGFDAECGFDVVKNSKCGFDLVREQAGCGFDAKSNSFVNVQCGFDNNCGFDIKA
jgi:hypothetical protein